MFKIGNRIVTFLPPQDIEPEALQQIENTASVPFLYRHVAVMPDTHYGKGATVGTVLATRGAIIPAAVGVDIGCGMIAVKTSLKREDVQNPGAIRHDIERSVPMSAGHNNKALTPSAAARVAHLDSIATRDYESIDRTWKLQLGTLGGGNHFIELATDEDNTVWLTLHSGSRGIGNKIGNLHIRKAQQQASARGVQLPDRDLAFLNEGTPEFEAYTRDLLWAQEFARLNRDEMMDRVIGVVVRATFGRPGSPP